MAGSTPFPVMPLLQHHKGQPSCCPLKECPPSSNKSLSAGTTVFSVSAVHTAGSSGRITYSIVSGNEKGAFHIHPTTGMGC